MIVIVFIYSIDATQTSLLQLFVGVAEDIGCCFQRSKEDDYLCQFEIYRSEVVSWKINFPIATSNSKCIFAGKYQCWTDRL